MLTQQQVLDTIKAGRNSDCLDGRDYARLTEFFPVSDWETLGFEPKEGIEHTPRPWTRESVLEQLAKDIDFGFEKALNRRGISSELMYEVVKMWMWVLEDELEKFDQYAQYGLPLFKAVAVKYGFPNVIGDDRGYEGKYATNYTENI
jgi:hypothetical protein